MPPGSVELTAAEKASGTHAAVVDPGRQDRCDASGYASGFGSAHSGGEGKRDARSGSGSRAALDRQLVALYWLGSGQLVAQQAHQHPLGIRCACRWDGYLLGWRWLEGLWGGPGRWRWFLDPGLSSRLFAGR